MVVVLIPSYKPDEKLLTLLNALSAQDKYAGLLVVDDGGGETYRPIFERAKEIPGVTVVSHAVNQGKGRALKTGINAAMNLYPGADIVTADADGQHHARGHRPRRRRPGAGRRRDHRPGQARLWQGHAGQVLPGQHHHAAGSSPFPPERASTTRRRAFAACPARSCRTCSTSPASGMSTR